MTDTNCKAVITITENGASGNLAIALKFEPKLDNSSIAHHLGADVLKFLTQRIKAMNNHGVADSSRPQALDHLL